MSEGVRGRINIIIMRKNFMVEQPTLLAASFSVKTNCDDEPIIANFDENGRCSFTVPSDMDAHLLSMVQDMCEGQFVPSVFARIRANKFFDEAIAEAKDISTPDDEFEKARQVVMDDVLATLLREVDDDDLRLFKDYFTEKHHSFESMSRVLSKLVLYKELKNKEN